MANTFNLFNFPLTTKRVVVFDSTTKRFINCTLENIVWEEMVGSCSCNGRQVCWRWVGVHSLDKFHYSTIHYSYPELRRVEKYSHAAGLFVTSVWMDSIIPKSTTLIQNLKYLHAASHCLKRRPVWAHSGDIVEQPCWVAWSSKQTHTEKFQR